MDRTLLLQRLRSVAEQARIVYTCCHRLSTILARMPRTQIDQRLVGSLRRTQCSAPRRRYNALLHTSRSLWPARERQASYLAHK